MDSSGRHVLVKAVPESSKEWRIISALMSLNYDPENHTIPIVDVLHRDGTVFIVQAQWHDYPFSRPLNFHQWIVVAYQVLEGLAFMHRQGIGHGDLHIGNLVCNYHGEAAYSELKNSSFRIAFIGFGTSVQCRGETRTIPHQEFIAPPFPYRLPKQESGSDTDLFARDVYALGQIIRAIAPVTSPQVPACYAAVLSQMTSADPNIRPSARVALALLTAAIEDAGVEGDSPSK
ncbi:kinase-like domain-containing protein [Mycena galericulata]|nr:kinase-like domain-containing protein [Mycena galericulata]